LEQAKAELSKAREEVGRAHHLVLSARSDLKRAELLQQRLAERENRAHERVERRAQDEHTALRFESLRRGRQR
jgi:flagellar biosynthesis chaperone FliJ